MVLRVVNRQIVEYLELRDSLKEHGFINSLCVRPAPQRGPDMYEVVDGLYRLNCCRDLDIPRAPCIVKDISDRLLLSLQIQANAIRPETTQIEYARQLLKIMEFDTSLRLVDLACMIHKSSVWVKNTLGLLNLSVPLQKKVERGEIGASNAYWLSKMHSSFQRDYAEQAETMSISEFAAMAKERIKAFNDAVRQGKMEVFYSTRYTPYPHLRPLKEIEAERLSMEAATRVMPQAKCRTPIDGWRMALSWVLHMDPDSVALLHKYHQNQEQRIQDRLQARRAALIAERKKKKSDYDT